MRIVEDVKLDFEDVLLVPKRSTISSRKEIDLKREFRFRYSPHIWRGIPIISANMDTITTQEVAQLMSNNDMLACLPKRSDYGKSLPNCIPTLGLEDNPVISSYFVCLDVANAYLSRFVDEVKRFRDVNQDAIIIAGNVSTPSMTETLLLAGADIIKIGTGPGAACSTRLLTGVGYPQLSAVMECADAAHGLNGHIISDGGCIYAGDLAKAFGAGADFVMLGGMLASHNENKREFYGMSSRKANDKYNGGLKEYRAAEGHEFVLPNRGPLQDTLQEITGGLRSACSYVGARTLKDLPKCSTFIKVNRIANTSMLKYKEE